jgi:hypothetical protein
VLPENTKDAAVSGGGGGAVGWVLVTGRAGYKEEGDEEGVGRGHRRAGYKASGGAALAASAFIGQVGVTWPGKVR